MSGSEEKIKVSDLKNLGSPFWLISFLCVTFYSAVFPFTVHAPRFLQKKFNMSPAMGGQYTSYIMTASMIFTPILGDVPACPPLFAASMMPGPPPLTTEKPLSASRRAVCSAIV